MHHTDRTLKSTFQRSGTPAQRHRSVERERRRRKRDEVRALSQRDGRSSATENRLVLRRSSSVSEEEEAVRSTSRARSTSRPRRTRVGCLGSSTDRTFRPRVASSSSSSCGPPRLVRAATDRSSIVGGGGGDGRRNTSNSADGGHRRAKDRGGSESGHRSKSPGESVARSRSRPTTRGRDPSQTRSKSRPRGDSDDDELLTSSEGRNPSRGRTDVSRNDRSKSSSRPRSRSRARRDEETSTSAAASRSRWTDDGKRSEETRKPRQQDDRVSKSSPQQVSSKSSRSRSSSGRPEDPAADNHAKVSSSNTVASSSSGWKHWMVKDHNHGLSNLTHYSGSSGKYSGGTEETSPLSHYYTNDDDDRTKGRQRGDRITKKNRNKNDDAATVKPAMPPARDAHAERIVTNLYDRTGRCVRHPHVRLRKKKMWGKGWNVLISNCPDCCLEEMGRLVEVTKKKEAKEEEKKKKKREDGTTGQVTARNITAENNKNKKTEMTTNQKHKGGEASGGRSCQRSSDDDNNNNNKRSGRGAYTSAAITSTSTTQEYPHEARSVRSNKSGRNVTHVPQSRSFDDSNKINNHRHENNDSVPIFEFDIPLEEQPGRHSQSYTSPRSVKSRKSIKSAVSKKSVKSNKSTKTSKSCKTAKSARTDGSARTEKSRKSAKTAEIEKSVPTAGDESAKTEKTRERASDRRSGANGAASPAPAACVANMPYTDHFGCHGKYSGEVNSFGQPHGKGVLRYEDGGVNEGIWVNGRCEEDERDCGRSVSNKSVSNRSMSNRSASNRSVSNRSVSNRSVSNRSQRSVSKSPGRSPHQQSSHYQRQQHSSPSQHFPQQNGYITQMPWSDVNGFSGHYTGEINQNNAPEGKGYMQYSNGVIEDGMWCNGVFQPPLNLPPPPPSTSCERNNAPSSSMSVWSLRSVPNLANINYDVSGHGNRGSASVYGMRY